MLRRLKISESTKSLALEESQPILHLQYLSLYERINDAIEFRIQCHSTMGSK